MSNWIDEEAKKYRNEKELEEKREDLILMSDYWENVKMQIVKDVEQINNNEIWKKALCGLLIKVTDTIGGRYEIKKERLPEVTMTVENKDNEIEVTKAIKRTNDSKKTFDTEILKVDSDGEKIYLQSKSGILHVPEEIAKHILMPIIQALNGTL